MTPYGKNRKDVEKWEFFFIELESRSRCKCVCLSCHDAISGNLKQCLLPLVATMFEFYGYEKMTIMSHNSNDMYAKSVIIFSFQVKKEKVGN